MFQKKKYIDLPLERCQGRVGYCFFCLLALSLGQSDAVEGRKNFFFNMTKMCSTNTQRSQVGEQSDCLAKNYERELFLVENRKS